MTKEECLIHKARITMAFDILDNVVAEVAQYLVDEGGEGEFVTIEETVVDGEKGDLFIRKVEVDEDGDELILKDRDGRMYYLNSIPAHDQALVLMRMLAKIQKTASSFSRDGGAS